MATLTAVVHTRNSASTLESCLKSLSFVDHILVVDMKSSDETVKIANTFDIKLLEHEDVGYVEPARQFALQQVKTDWTLILDADEEIPATLASELKKIISDENAADVYFIPRKNIVFDKWIEHSNWWPDYQLRLFKTGQVSWPVQIHAQPTIQGRIEHLQPSEELSIVHHNYQTIEQYVERLNRYTSVEVDRGQSSAQPSKHDPSTLPSAFSQEFASRFFAAEGYLDGGHGLALAYLQSMYQVVVELKRWQANGFADNRKPNELVKRVEESLNELNYWVASYSIQRTTGIPKFIWMIRRKLADKKGKKRS